MTTKETKTQTPQEPKQAPAPRMAVINRDDLFTPGELELLQQTDGSYAAFVLKEMADMVQLIRQGVDKETFDLAMENLDKLKGEHLDASIEQLKTVQADRYESKSPYYDGSTVDRDNIVESGTEAG